jgi:hypothetical protein
VQVGHTEKTESCEMEHQRCRVIDIEYRRVALDHWQNILQWLDSAVMGGGV